MSTPVLKKVHTFADDLNHARGERGIVVKKATGEVQKMPAQALTKDQVVISDTPGSGPKKITTANSSVLKPSANDLPATIITDQRGKRFDLTAEMSSAIGEWWNDKIRSVKKTKKKNVYGLPAAERRKGVVTAATTHTGRNAVSDYHAIVERVKSKPEPTPRADTAPASPAPQVVATAPEVTGTTDWETASAVPVKHQLDLTSMITDDGDETTLESALPTLGVGGPESGVTVTDVTYRQPRIVPTIPDIASQTDTDTEYEIDEEVDDEVEDEFEEILPTVAPPTPQEFQKITPTVPYPAATAVATPSAFTLLSEVPVPTLQNKPDYVKSSIATRIDAASTTSAAPNQSRLLTFAPYIAGAAFVLISVGTISYYMFSTSSSTPPVTSSTELPSVQDTTISPDLGFTPQSVSAQLDAPNKISLYNAIGATAGLGDELQIITPLASDTNLPLGVRDILSLINRQFSPTFVGTINSIKVGMYQEEPVIILTVSDKANAQGGLFAWEATMSEDLSPWFGLPLRSNTTTTLTDFVDNQNNSIDTRVLKDDLGASRITYGFVNDTTIIITTTDKAFSDLSSLPINY